MAVTYDVDWVDHWSLGGRLGGSALARTFTVEATDAGKRYPLQVSDLEAVQAAGAIPKAGDAVAGAFATTSVFATLRYRRFEATETGGVLTVNAFASTRYVWDAQYPVGEASGAAWLPIVGAFAARAINLRAYRSWLDCTYPANPLTLPGTDIGGTKIDSGGEPRETVIEGGELIVSGWLNTYATKKGDAWADAANNFIGRLNSEVFLGFPKATLLCTDYQNPAEEDEYHEQGFRFLYSPAYHLEQIASFKPDGKPDLNASAQAATVKWTRTATQGSVDFNTMFGAAGDLRDFIAWRVEHGLYVMP